MILSGHLIEINLGSLVLCEIEKTVSVDSVHVDMRQVPESPLSFVSWIFCCLQLTTFYLLH